jgi:hypothetical protein
MGNGDEETTVNIEKTDDEEEINARNEFQMFVNDHDNDGNRNKQVILKSKEMDVDKLKEIAKEMLSEDFTQQGNKGKPSRPGMN